MNCRNCNMVCDSGAFARDKATKSPFVFYCKACLKRYEDILRRHYKLIVPRIKEDEVFLL